MIDYGYRKALLSRSDIELKGMIVTNNNYHKEAIYDAQNILFERKVNFQPVYPEMVNKYIKDEVLNINDNSLWDYAYKLKKSGLNEPEILKNILAKGINSIDIIHTLKRLPVINYISDEFATFIKTKYKTSLISSLIFLILLISILTFISTRNENVHQSIILGLWLGIIISIFTLFRNTGFFSGSNFWIEMIKNEPENIVWIKPIVEKLTIAHIITLDTTKKFQLYTIDGRKLEIICDSEIDLKMFFKSIKENLPHAHIGYSMEVLKLYNQSPLNFINTLKQKNIFMPFDKAVV